MFLWIVKLPITGEVKELSKYSDETFANGGLETGILILPKEGKVYAPFSGTIEYENDSFFWKKYRKYHLFWQMSKIKIWN